MDHLLDTLTGEHVCNEFSCGFDDVMHDAADEIKRLRTDRMDCQIVMDCQQLEIERLREALRLARRDMQRAIGFIAGELRVSDPDQQSKESA